MRTGVRFCIGLPGALSPRTWARPARAGACATFWTVATQADFLKGDVEDLSIDSDGRVFLGPSTSLVAETAAPFLWTVVPAADGSFWAGTGNEGKVLKIGKDGKVATFFDATELEVHAIVPAPNNGLYVATSPDGKIYHVSADGTARTFFDPEDKYIWALALDRTGNLFAATGDKGVIYKITPGRQGHALLQDELDQRRVAGLLRRREISSPEPSRPDASSGSTPPARRSSSSTRRSRRSTRSGWPTTGRSMRRR